MAARGPPPALTDNYVSYSVLVVVVLQGSFGLLCLGEFDVAVHLNTVLLRKKALKIAVV